MLNWLARVFGLSTKEPSSATGPLSQVDVGRHGHNFWFDIVGEASYQGTLWKIAAGRTLREERVVVPCLIVPEPLNRFDPKALAVEVPGYGKVGYFQRDEASGRFHALGDLLRQGRSVGTCHGRLIGGWQSDIHIGVRLAIAGPETWDPTVTDDVAVVLRIPDWGQRRRVPLGPNKAGFKRNISMEHRCRQTIERLSAGRFQRGEPVIFPAVIIPQHCAPEYGSRPELLVFAEGHGPVGVLRGEGEHEPLLRALVDRKAVGTCEAMLFDEGAWIGVKLSMHGPKTAVKAVETSTV